MGRSVPCNLVLRDLVYYYFLPLRTDARAQNCNSLVASATKIWVLATTF